jgi:hypothetical protein
MRSRWDTGHVCQRKQLVIEFDVCKIEFSDRAQDIEGFVERAAQHLGHWLEVALVGHRAESISASVPSRCGRAAETSAPSSLPTSDEWQPS